MANTTVKKHHSEFINEREAAQLLGIKVRTLQNYVCTGKVPERIITRGVTGDKFYHRPSLIGLEN